MIFYQQIPIPSIREIVTTEIGTAEHYVVVESVDLQCCNPHPSLKRLPTIFLSHPFRFGVWIESYADCPETERVIWPLGWRRMCRGGFSCAS